MIIDIKKLNLLMANQCMSLNELSEKSGVDPVTISRVKNGRQNPRPQTLGKIARALDTNVESMIQN